MLSKRAVCTLLLTSHFLNPQPLAITVLGRLKVSEAFYGYACSTLLPPLCGRILTLVCLLLILQHIRQGAGILPFIFPEVELTF